MWLYMRDDSGTVISCCYGLAAVMGMYDKTATTMTDVIEMHVRYSHKQWRYSQTMSHTKAEIPGMVVKS